MTNLTDAEHIEHALELVETFREQVANNDLRPCLRFFVEGVPRVMMFPNITSDTEIDHRESRSQTAWATTVIAAAIEDLDEIVWAFDSYSAQGEVGADGKFEMNKSDGTRWGPGEMQWAVQNQTADAHLVSEAVSILSVSADDVRSTMVPYDRVGSDGTDDIVVKPDKTFSFSTAGQEGGDFGHILREAFEAPKMMKVLKESDGYDAASADLTENDMKVHLLCVAVKAVMSQVRFPCAIGMYDEHEAELIKKSMEGFNATEVGVDEDDD